VVVKVGSGRYTFVADERMALAGTVLGRIDTVADAVRAADLPARDERELLRALDGAADGALKALEELRRDDVADAASALARSLRSLEGFDRAGLSAAPVRQALGQAITDYLDVRLSVTPDPTTVRPGDELAVRVRVVNGAHATLREPRAGLSWPRPAEASLGDRLSPRAVGTVRFSSVVPEAQPLGDVDTAARVSYRFDGAFVEVLEPFTVEVVSAVSATASVAPSPVRPGASAEVTTTLRNAGRAPVSGELRVGVPSGWTAPAAQPVTVPAGAEVAVKTVVTVPRDAPQAARDVTLTATFGELASAEATLRVEIGPLGEPLDHVDLGVAASEQAHGLTASPSSGTSTEAGLTRRYAGHLTPFSYFELDLAVTPGAAFVLRVVETYDRAQTKRYKVYVDGREVHLRTFTRGSGGTETYEFVVPAVTAAKARVRFENQDDPAFYDPSIADVWTLNPT
jgi:hypothetical protein